MVFQGVGLGFWLVFGVFFSEGTKSAKKFSVLDTKYFIYLNYHFWICFFQWVSVTQQTLLSSIQDNSRSLLSYIVSYYLRNFDEVSEN